MARQNEVIHGQLVNTDAATLLVPNTAVAEIVHFSEPEQVGDAPSWLLGTMEWRGLRIPVVSFERATGVDSENPGAGHRIAILNGVNSGDQLQFFAIVIRGNPRLVNLSRDDIATLADRDADKLQLQSVSVKDVSAVIPDLAQLEQMVSKAGYRSERVH